MTSSDEPDIAPRLTLFTRSAHSPDPDYDTRITVFDTNGREVGQSFGEAKLELPRGIYVVRAERLGEIGEDRYVLHEKDSNLELAVPKRYSAMPSFDTFHTQKFLRSAGEHFSRTSTRAAPQVHGGHSRLMILVRATGDHDHSHKHPAAGLGLFAEDGSRVSAFEPERTERDTAQGWVAFSSELPPGNYIVAHYHAKQTLSLPLLLHSGWDTLIFVPFERRVRLSAASIYMVSHDRGYDPADLLTQRLDAAIQGLGMQLDLLPKNLRLDAIRGKFKHPFIGLIGAYAHFLGDWRQERLERDMLHNLWRLLEGAPDVIALLLLAKQREGQMPDTLEGLSRLGLQAFGTPLHDHLPMHFPPMLRSGLETIVRASQCLPCLIAPGSWLEAAASSAYADGAWSVWDKAVQWQVQHDDSQLPAQSPSPQRTYWAVKRAIARVSTHEPQAIHADDTLAKLVDTEREDLVGVFHSIEQELPGYDIAAGPEIVRMNQSVRELVRRVGDATRPAGLAILRPDTTLPDWLVNLVQEHMARDQSQDRLLTVARITGMPLGTVERAAKQITDAQTEAWQGIFHME